MSYEDAPVTKMLATHCAVCGRPLCDAESVEMGIGPECADKYGIPREMESDVKRMCNQLTWAAATNARLGKVEEVRQCAVALRTIGMDVLADAITRRYEGAERKSKINVLTQEGRLLFEAPFRRGEKDEYLAAVRALPGRRWHADLSCNSVPVNSKPQLWALLCRFYPSMYGTADGRIFQVPPKEDS